MSNQQHLNERVQQKLIELNDVICEWERATSRESVLIFREVGEFCYRSVSGKPGVPNDISDVDLMKNILDIDITKSNKERDEEELHKQINEERLLADELGDGKGPEHRNR